MHCSQNIKRLRRSANRRVSGAGQEDGKLGAERGGQRCGWLVGKRWSLASRKESQANDECFVGAWVPDLDGAAAAARREDAMADRVKAASGLPKRQRRRKRPGRKPPRLLLAVLEELKASRAESAALRKLLAQVLATLARPEGTEESFIQEAIGSQEGSARFSASRRLNRSPVAIQFIATTRTGSQEGKEAQG